MAAPVAPAAPLLEVAGTRKLRVRFAAPPAEPACSEMAVYLRTIGGGVPWRAVNGATRRACTALATRWPTVACCRKLGGSSAPCWRAAK